MTDKHLHIVCLDVPYPVDYGGVFDLFYKIKSLYESGIHIHLHCFEYGRGAREELNKYCTSVKYYQRKSFIKSVSFRLPYIVSSRANPSLLHNLLQDNYPVLLEGIHCTYFLFSGDLKNRKVMVRLHNVEYEYYRELSKATNNFLKKIYFKQESSLLKKYEKRIAGKTTFLTVSEKDTETYRREFGATDVRYLPVFLPFTHVKSEAGPGNFCLYHGNLSVPENAKAARWLIKNVGNLLDIPFVIAGKNPPGYFEKQAHKNDNICIVANPSTKDMDELIRKAQVHLLPSFNKTGVKIKLLNALFNGKYVITNKDGVDGTALESLCEIANTASAYKKMTAQLFHASFTDADITKRKNILEGKYDNEANAQKLIQWIW
ncbi:MAG: glycosyltransferase [Ginsengibacter sp.]